MPKKKTHNEFILQLSRINPTIIPVGQYVNSQSHILCRCTICDHQWQGIPNNLLRKEGCPRCARNQRVTHEDFLLKMAQIHPDITVIGKYVNIGTNIDCVCNVCGTHFSSAPYSLYSGRGCKKCGRIRAAKKLAKSNEAFIEKLKKTNPGIVPLEEYKTAKQKILCRCTCGNTWFITPCSLYRGSKCIKCRSERDKKAKDPSTFTEEIAKCNPDIELLEPYYRSNKKVKARCKICGHEWKTWPMQLLRGDNCPNCIKRLSTSFPEQAVFYYVKSLFPEAINSYKDGFGKLELDIFIPSLNVGIEYDGRKWHENNSRAEKAKYIICKQNNIRLIRIRERPESDNIGTICDNTIPSKYGDTKSFSDLDCCITQLLDLLKTDCSAIEINVKKHQRNIESNYYRIIQDKSLGTLFPEIASEWYQSKNGTITPYMVMPKCNNSYYWKCKECGHIYPSAVSNRTAGHGCPKCAGQYRRTPEDFVREVAKLSPDLEIVSLFKNTESKINVRCKKCGTIDIINARSLLQGAKCKQCSYSKLHDDRVMAEEEFINRIAAINPNIEITGKYINAAKSIACKCRICGHEWNPNAGSILYQNTGCPRCSGRMNKRVLCIETGVEYKSVNEAEKKTGVFHSTISRCCNGKAFTAGGYHWKFI